MKILNYKDANDGKNTAFFDVEVANGLIFPNLRLKPNKKGDGSWIDFPSYVKSEDAAGNKQWGKYPTMSEERAKEFKKQVQDLLREQSLDQNTPF
jgi:hypothetical protein